LGANQGEHKNQIEERGVEEQVKADQSPLTPAPGQSGGGRGKSTGTGSGRGDQAKPQARVCRGRAGEGVEMMRRRVFSGGEGGAALPACGGAGHGQRRQHRVLVYTDRKENQSEIGTSEACSSWSC
jgi:hypothetical protein